MRLALAGFLAGVLSSGAASGAVTFYSDIAPVVNRNCAPCHGTRMRSPEVPADLSKFPPDEKNRFVRSVTNGKNQMPPWGGVLQSAEIEALWAYVVAGEKK